MDVSELHRRGENHSGFGESRIEHRVGDRHSCFVGYFRKNPLGRYPHDMTVLSLLPPVDRCLILEMVLFFGFCDRIVAVDKLSMAYFKAGWEDVAFRFLESCYRGQLLNYGEYSYIMDKLDGLPVHGVSEDYDDTLRKLPQYYIPGDPFCELLKAFCEKYRGDDVLASLNLNRKDNATDMQDFLRDRLRFCDALERKSEHLGRD